MRSLRLASSVISETPPEYVKALDTVGLSWLTYLCSMGGGIYTRVLERRIQPIVEPWIQEDHWPSSLPSMGHLRVDVSLLNQAKCVLLIWSRHLNMSPVVSWGVHLCGLWGLLCDQSWSLGCPVNSKSDPFLVHAGLWEGCSLSLGHPCFLLTVFLV